MRRLPYLLALLALPLAASGRAVGAAPVLPTAHFSRPMMAVGQPLDYVLSYQHAPDAEVIFPDSLANFQPFEYEGRTWRPTRTSGGQSFDEVVYHLRAFALASEQRLQLPVLVLGEHGDTLRVLPAPALVQLVRTAPALPAGGELPALRTDYQTLPLDSAFNYPYWLVALAGAGALAAGAWVLFGRGWRATYSRYKRRKNHVYFLAQFARYAERFTLSRSASVVERAVVLWKNYLSSLEDINLTSLTTKELVDHFHHDDSVGRALRATDRVVYGNLVSEDAREVDTAFQRLRAFAEQQYGRLGS